MAATGGDESAETAGSGPAPGGVRHSWLLTVARVVGLFVLAGALSGWLWQTLWTPPTGIASSGAFYLDGPGLRADFSGTGIFVLVGLGAGAVLGAGCGFARRDPRVLFAGVLLGSVLGALTCAWAGHWLGPADPAVLAVDLPDQTAMVADLRIVGEAPYLAWPIGAICGFLVAIMRPTAPTGRHLD